MRFPKTNSISTLPGPEGLGALLEQAACSLGLTLELVSPLLPEPIIAAPDSREHLLRTLEAEDDEGEEISAEEGGPSAPSARPAALQATLTGGQEELGCLQAVGDGGVLSPQRQELFEATAAWVAALLQREAEADRLVRELASAYDQLTLACELGDKLRLANNERHLAELLLEHLCGVVRNDGGVVLVEGETEGQGDKDEEVGPLHIVAVEGLAVADLPRIAEGCRWLYAPEARGAGVAGGLILSAGEIGLAQPDGQVLIALLQAEPRVRGTLMLARKASSPAFHSSEARLVVAAAHQAAIAMANLRLKTRLSRLLTGTVRALATAVDAKDPYTRGHSQRVADLAVACGRLLGMSLAELERVQVAGLLHDVGKIAVHTETLQRPGALSPAEWTMIHDHPSHSASILSCVPEMAEVVAAVASHHERLDGSGYPRGLEGDEIPLLARVVSVCDAYDAMISPRPYRKPLTKREALRELREGAGTQYDPEVVEVLAMVVGEDRSQPAQARHPQRAAEADAGSSRS